MNPFWPNGQNRKPCDNPKSNVVATAIFFFPPNHNIYIYICIYTRIPVATLPDSSPPQALRGGSEYGLYDTKNLISHLLSLNHQDFKAVWHFYGGLVLFRLEKKSSKYLL